MKEIYEENIWKAWTNAQKSDLIHDFTMRNYDRANKSRDYGLGETCTPVEAHLLEKIYLNQGITISELAKSINRSRSAVSQIVAKLENRGLVIKVAQKNHAKKLSLFVTEKGEGFTLIHMSYDERMAGEFLGKLSKSFDDDTMNAFFQVLYKFLKNMSPTEGYHD